MAVTQYTIRRKVLTLFGASFHIYDADQKLIGFSRQKAFKLKEDIRVYTDDSMQQERLAIKARSIIDFGAAYDIVDSRTNEKLGALKRKGWSSMIRDSWLALDEHDEEIGAIQEDSMMLALVRRFLGGALIPQSFHLKGSGEENLATFRTHFNPFVHRMTVTVEEGCHLNPLFILAAGLLLVAIEGRQN